MYNKKILVAIFICIGFFSNAQTNNLQFKDGTKEKRAAFYTKVVNGINKTLALDFTEVYDENWQSAFYNIGLIQYKTPLVSKRMDDAAKALPTQSVDFQKAFINLANSNYSKKYNTQIQLIFSTATDSKLIAMAANYLLQTASLAEKKVIQQTILQKLIQQPQDDILIALNKQIQFAISPVKVPAISSFFANDYLQGEVIVFSFQRKDRNYAGIAMVRNANGNFLKNRDGQYFNVAQLARSNSNMPGFITNGNTPQGIFKMNGFDTSTNYFIGPTPNIQLEMPHEYSKNYTPEGKLIDSTWLLPMYRNLLPPNFRDYEPMYGSFYAGKIGRTEIIAHGTTIDAEYYKNSSYYSFTPTAGCLCTREKWNSNTGLLEKSDQLELYNAIQKAGGAKGYLIVVEIDNKKTAVSLTDINMYLPK
jgi:hypothetical protein